MPKDIYVGMSFGGLIAVIFSYLSEHATEIISWIDKHTFLSVVYLVIASWVTIKLKGDNF